VLDFCRTGIFYIFVIEHVGEQIIITVCRKCEVDPLGGGVVL
jgi:hypothetical protein